MTVAGEVVLDGTDFRNGAHLRYKADLFVPCGGPVRMRFRWLTYVYAADVTPYQSGSCQHFKCCGPRRLRGESPLQVYR